MLFSLGIKFLVDSYFSQHFDDSPFFRPLLLLSLSVCHPFLVMGFSPLCYILRFFLLFMTFYSFIIICLLSCFVLRVLMQTKNQCFLSSGKYSAVISFNIPFLELFLVWNFNLILIRRIFIFYKVCFSFEVILNL